MTYDTDGLHDKAGPEREPARDAGPSTPSQPDASTKRQNKTQNRTQDQADRPGTALTPTDQSTTDNHTTNHNTPHQNKPESPSALPAHPHTTQAAHGMAAIGQMFARDLTAQDMLDSLRVALSQDGDGEAMLFNQAQVLDTLFHRLTVNALSGVDDDGQPVPDYVDIERVNLLLRAQKQCRTTIEVRNALRRKKAEIQKNHEQKERFE
jgi:hypothetical protein